MTQPSNSAVFAARLQSEDSEGLGNDNPLLFVIRWWDTLEDLQSLHGSGATSALVRNHTPDSLVENAGRSTEMERTCTSVLVDLVVCNLGNFVVSLFSPPRVGLKRVILRR